ncbi:MAG: outer membrane beta-barrel protein [Bacteroidales bacterium]|nr:outer membrane beta-barrel protein [Bacteroidales bacterium]
MKKSILVFFLMIMTSGVFAQQLEPGAFRKFSLQFDLFTDIWQKAPAELNASAFNRGINIYGLMNNRIGESRFDFSYGGSIGIHNLYGDALPEDQNGKTVFVTIDTALSYSKAKIVLTYFDFPLEIRYRSKGAFRAYAGIKLGFLLQAHSKYTGDDPDGRGYEVTIKRDDIRYLNLWRYVVYARAGYKWINVFGSMNLNPVFKDGQGPDMYPISVGISITPF